MWWGALPGRTTAKLAFPRSFRPSNDCEQSAPHGQDLGSALLAAMTKTMLGRRWYTRMDDASTRRFVEELLVAADASEALDRAEQRARAEAAKHREQERAHREAAEAAELLARRLAGIRQLDSVDSSDPAPADAEGHRSSAPSRGLQERATQAARVRGALSTWSAGEKVWPKKIFDQLTAQGAAVTLSNVQLEMGRLAKDGKLPRPQRGDYKIPDGGFIESE